MKKTTCRKMTLMRETLRQLDPGTLAGVPGALATTPAGPQQPTLPNTIQGTSCGLCSDYVYCGPSANGCLTNPDPILAA